MSSSTSATSPQQAAAATTAPAGSSTSSSALPSVHVNGQTAKDKDDGGNGGDRAALRKNMLKKLRPYPLRHEWVFWHDRYNAASEPAGGAASAAADGKYENQLKELAEISTIQAFWQVMNNTPFELLSLRDSFLLFKKNVKPIWEDPRNNKGGAWSFRISKANNTSYEFWKEVLMMAIGEVLQEVVEKGDDICGVSVSVRFNSHLILIWNRDGSNQKSIDAILKRVLESIPPELKPMPQNYYYKKHSEHKGFKPLTDSKAGASAPLQPSGLKEELKK